ncbi:hypothetical protein jhhlp_001563 [Lomentospora prolificans]|uniref:Carrier domain-containing protein n=1 Tax=Lomentospora prolificans TaxID=41688 RepID=A0A2N3NIK2_9PEZI|nr:hypothetical protein jhhlp_001563 [Lomentospora prolificans]
MHPRNGEDDGSSQEVPLPSPAVEVIQECHNEPQPSAQTDLNEAIQDGSPKLSATDLEQIWKWNNVLPPTITECTHETISRRAREHPEKLAVQSWEGQLTYGEIETYSTRLALRLCHFGVRIGTRVPLLFEKSMWTVVGVLAIMKAGGTFILTDPSQPEARLRTIAEEAAAQFILTSKTQEKLGRRVAPTAELFIVPGDDIYRNQAALSSIHPSPTLVPDTNSDLPAEPSVELHEMPIASSPHTPPLSTHPSSPDSTKTDRPEPVDEHIQPLAQASSQDATITESPAPATATSSPQLITSVDDNTTVTPQANLPVSQDTAQQAPLSPVPNVAPILLPSPPPSITDSCTAPIADAPTPTISLPDVPPNNPMYIIFTSGSTGKPKGVVISHENYASGAVPRGDAVGYRAHSKVFDFASYAFDVSIDCMLCTLANGGCLCVPSEADRMNDLSGAIRKSGANMAHMTPSVARVLDSDIIPSLEVLGLGGEAVSASDAATWSKDTTVVIAYGPSECTVGCTVNNNVKVSTNIGYGVGGLTWIVDPEDHNRLVPVGEIGELLIEGPVVGIGYLNDPVKTSEVFISDPTWLLEGHGDFQGRRGRLYKTGDLVRYDPNGAGSIAFVGRKDQQVKLRGQRVELSEVEHHLRRHLQQYAQIVAEVIYPSGGEPTLVAFLAESKSSSHTSEPEFSEFSGGVSAALVEAEAALEKEIPRYMIPSTFVPLTLIPTLVSGKTNRKKIKEIGQSMSREQLASMKRLRRPTERPQTEMEIVLHALWVKVLGVDAEIGLQDSFLALGGDSLRAMKLASVAREENFQLTVATIFQHPTLKEMAARMEKADQNAATPVTPFSMIEGWEPSEAKIVAAELCSVSVDDIEDIYPCTPLQEALMALSAKVREAYVAQRVVRLDCLDMATRLEEAFNTATAGCAILRTRIIQVPEHGLVQVLLNKGIEWSRGNDVDKYLVQDRDEAMDLGKPLVRYGMFQNETTGGYEFVLTMHHALYDGWSMPLVVDRINRAYKDEPASISPHFREFIKYLKNLDREAGERYWKEKLAGATGPQFPMLPWPSYQPQAESLLEHYVPIQRHPSSKATIATILRGAWALVASEYTASRDVVFGETLTGRNAPIAGAELIEGPMITTVPVRLRVDLGETISEYLNNIQIQTAEQIPHEHIGLQHIRRLSPDALQACELRTGIVLHPTADPDQVNPDAELPASRLVPAGDEEAAQEALKFNTYALMLVCSLDPKGFLIMASFDSKTVDVKTMDNALHQLGHVVQQLCQDPEKALGDIEFLTEDDKQSLQALSTVCAMEAEVEYPGTNAIWVVDLANPHRLVPRGALGELIVQSTEDLALERLDTPEWIKSQHPSEKIQHLYKTGRLAVFTSEGSLQLKGLKSQLPSNYMIPKARAKTMSATSGKQKALRTLWARVLHMAEEDISLGDSFFQLGGDSISAMKLVSEARNAGWSLTVAKAFQNRTLYDMARILEELDTKPVANEVSEPYSLIDGFEVDISLPKIRSSLADPNWEVVDVLPVRPLQAVAIDGTIRIPRFSARYEIMYFNSPIDRTQLYRACQELVSMNEILRTVFIKSSDEYLAVVLEDLPTPVVEYHIDQGLEGFTRNLCDLDVQTSMPLGSAFVKWFHVQEVGGRSCLIFRISHSQYDEICLPLLLKQLSAIYEKRTVPTSLPFSSYVQHVVRRSIPESIGYWRELLEGSAMTMFRPDIPVTNTDHYAIEKTFDISARSMDTTVATIPTAVWALTLARRAKLNDVTFGEVVSGRNIDFHHANTVMGPCWQYAPVRVKFDPTWTGADLLAHVQDQHIAGSAYEAMGLPEIIQNCTDWPSDITWYDTVVHQDVDHVTELPFQETTCQMETYYAQAEPLREWKIQAFFKGDELTIEIVTVESWKEVAHDLLGEIGEVLKELLYRPDQLVLAPV